MTSFLFESLSKIYHFTFITFFEFTVGLSSFSYLLYIIKSYGHRLTINQYFIKMQMCNKLYKTEYICETLTTQ